MDESGRVKKILLIIIEWLLIIGLVVAVYFGYNIYKEYTRETNLLSDGGVTLVINQGDGLQAIAAKAEENGLVSSKYLFLVKAIESGYMGRFQPGTYELNKGMSLVDMMDIMSQIEISVARETTRFTIPEGYSIQMMGQRLEELRLCTAQEFYAAANRTDYGFDFLEEIPADHGDYALQGFLFPDTYEIYVGDGAEVIVMKMLEGFQNHLTKLESRNDLSVDYSIYDLVTMASIVEREAKLAEERPTIAGVIYNRLNINMKLQMCPTVLYVTTEGMYNVNQVLYADLEIDDPYNTYFYAGLPTGPICSPGAASLEAVAKPESHSYFYYHTDDEVVGNHIFKTTFQEHIDTRIKK